MKNLILMALDKAERLPDDELKEEIKRLEPDKKKSACATNTRSRYSTPSHNSLSDPARSGKAEEINCCLTAPI